MSDERDPASELSDLPFDDDELTIESVEFTPERSEVLDSELKADSVMEHKAPKTIRIRSGQVGRERTVAEPAVPSEPFTLRSRRGVALVAAASVIVLAAVGTLINRGSVVQPAVPTVEPVASSEVVCPITTATNDLTSAITAAVAPLPTVVDGTANLANLVKTGASTDPLVIKSPGTLVSRVFRGKSGPAQMASSLGSYATGFGADQSIRSGMGASRGRAIAPCSRSVTDAWLLGGSSLVGHLTTILLVNNDDRSAQVDLEIFGADGQISSPGATGIAVAGASTLRVSLAALAPNQPVTAVHVVVQSGRVGASALEFDSNGLTPQGVSAMSASTAGRSLVIPMIPKKVAAARLILLAPSRDATAHVTLLTTQGAATPVGFDSVQLTAGEVQILDLTKVLAGGSGGLMVKADGDIVAGAVVTSGGKDQLREGDKEAATPALTSPGLITGLAGPHLVHELGIAAPSSTATVKVDLYVGGKAAPTWTRTVTVKQGSIVDEVVPVSTPDSTSMILVTPVSGGPVYVTRVETELGRNGPMLGLAPLLPIRATTLVPPVESVPGSAVLAGP